MWQKNTKIKHMCHLPRPWHLPQHLCSCLRGNIRRGNDRRGHFPWNRVTTLSKQDQKMLPFVSQTLALLLGMMTGERQRAKKDKKKGQKTRELSRTYLWPVIVSCSFSVIAKNANSNGCFFWDNWNVNQYCRNYFYHCVHFRVSHCSADLLYFLFGLNWIELRYWRVNERILGPLNEKTLAIFKVCSIWANLSKS